MSRQSLTRRAVLKTAVLAPSAIAAGSAGGAVRPRRLRRRYAVGGHLGPLGARRQSGSGKDLPGWAAKEKVELKFDLITSNGDKDLLTLMAEGQARPGHDIMGLRTWYVASQEKDFVPVDDIVNPLTAEDTARFRHPRSIARKSTAAGWRCRPATAAARCRPAPASIIFKEYAGLDVRRCIPGRTPSPTRNWSTTGPGKPSDRAEKCRKGGHPLVSGSAPAPTRSMWRAR
jgi:hypothetical protein